MTDIAIDEYRKLNTRIWALIGIMLFLAILSFSVLGLSVDFRSVPGQVFAAICYGLVTYVFCLVWRNGSLAKALLVIGQLQVITFLAFLLTYAASDVHSPYRDAELNSIDRWFGFDRVAFLEFLRPYSNILAILKGVYHSMGVQCLLLPLILILSGNLIRLQKYVLAFGLSLIATSFVASLVPAVSAKVFIDLQPHAAAYFPIIEALRDGSLRHISPATFEGLITFPSFHTTCAILFMWAGWELQLGRYVFVPINLLMIIATPIHGGHYLIDVVGGTVVAFGTIAIVNRLSVSSFEPRKRWGVVYGLRALRKRRWSTEAETASAALGSESGV
jgi:membrane-associated phospholipid phosphatase